ncbi:MAG: hypothetical protein V4719_27865 [Planctomycetota bacterium]
MSRDRKTGTKGRHGGRQRSLSSLPGWLISLVVHALLCLFCLDRVAGAGRFRPGNGGEPLNLSATFTRADSAGSAGAGLDTQISSESEVAVGQTTDAEIIPPVAQRQPESTAEEATESVPPPDTSGEGPAVPEVVASTDKVRAIKQKYRQLLQQASGSGDAAGEDSGNGGGGPGTATGRVGGGGSGGTSFFEVGGQGNLFCYVVDCSSSMEEENSIGVARAELLASLQQLDASQRFQVLFYDSELHLMENGKQHTFFATDTNRRFARQFITSQQPTSGTFHKPALLAALKMTPDVIFFLTDGDTPELSFRDLWDLKQANRKRTQINVIEFGKGAKLGSLDWLEQLARDHRGSYRYQDVTAWETP